MKKTNIYGFGYLEPGDLTAELLDMDQRRFLAIENNVQHLFTIFGNGVLEEIGSNEPSWEIQSSNSNNLEVQISRGQGHVAWKYCKTEATTVPLPLTSSVFPAKFWIYATPNETSPELGTVNFIASLVEINDPNYYVGLGAVVVDTDSDGSFQFQFLNDADNGRVVINLFNTLASRINKHKHIGGTRNPSPIDLSAHVQGKLSGDFITDLDASKVTKGILAPERLPQIDHRDLGRRGTLSHNEIDSLLADISYPTGSRLSDLFIVNLLQLALALKKQNNLNQIDRNLINIIMYQPGYNADDSFVAYYADWDAETDLTNVDGPFVPDDISLAKIEKDQHRIIGASPTPSSSDNIFWRTDVDFQRAYDETFDLPNNASKFIQIIGVDDPAYFTLAKPYNFINLSNWETNSKTDIYSTSRGWTFAFVTDTDNPNTTDQIEFDTYLLRIFKDSSNNNIAYDFNNVDKLGISFSVLNSNSNVFMFLVLESGGTKVDFNLTNNVKTINKSSEVTLYDIDEDGSQEDILAFDINSFLNNFTEEQKSKVIGFGFRYSNDKDLNIQLIDADLNASSAKLATPEFSRAQKARIFGVEEEEIPKSEESAVFAWNEKFYSRTGQLVFRYNDPSGNPTFSTVVADKAGEADGASVRIFTRVATTETNLNLSGFIEINPDDTVSSNNNKGNWIDIQVRMTASADGLSAPAVDKIGLAYIRTGSVFPKSWDTRDEFVSQGETFKNISVVTNISPFGNGINLTGVLRFLPNSKNVVGIGNSTKFTTELSAGTILYKSPGTALGIVNSITNDFNLILKDNATSFYEGAVFLSSGNTDFLQISDTSEVGNLKFLKFDKYGISTYYSASQSVETEIPLGATYTTPYQAWQRITLNGLQQARDAFILPNKHVVFADTLNDRVIEVTETGSLVRAIQGNVRLKRNVRDFVALTAYYNPRISTLYVCFSQYFTIKNQARMNIRFGSQIISFDNTGRATSDAVLVSQFKKVSWAKGAGNGVNIPSTPKYSGEKSATLQVVFQGNIKNQVNAWAQNATGNILITIENDAVEWDGNDGIPFGTSSNGGEGGDEIEYGKELPKYLTTPKNLFKNFGTSDLLSEEFVAFRGLLPIDEFVPIEGDFNGDNILPEGTSTINKNLFGPDEETPAVLKVFVGDIVMDNLFSPISIQVIEQDNWVVAACGEYSVNRYDSYGSNISRYQVSFGMVQFIEGKGGSAYLMSNPINKNNLNDRNLLIAAPGQSNTIGKVLVINQTTNASLETNKILRNFDFVNLDAVRALPDRDDLHYWVALDDNITDGVSSKVVKIDLSGNVVLEWGTGEQDLTHPVGLSFTENGDLLVSE